MVDNPNIKVAVIGPFYNGERHVRGWVDALSLQKYPLLSLYVVDDASGDATALRLRDEIRKRNLPAKLLELSHNVGPAAARNLAIKQALEDGNDLILLLDSDCRVEPHWIEKHVSFHARYPEIGILGGAIEGKASTAVGIADGFCSWFTAVPYSESGKVSRLHLSSTNLSIKASVFGKIGFFDESFATGEDVAFCRKAQKAGIILWMQSDIVVTHLDRNTLQEAKKHHYRWGLHSYALSKGEHGGYYEVLDKIDNKLLVALLVPVIAALNVLLILLKYSRKNPKVWLYLPWIVILKWSNALGVYRGYLDPTRCLKVRS